MRDVEASAIPASRRSTASSRSNPMPLKSLAVCGYSFRDVHINYLLFSWLEAEPTRTVHVFDPVLRLEQPSALSMQPNAMSADATAETAAGVARSDASKELLVRDHMCDRSRNYMHLES